MKAILALQLAFFLCYGIVSGLAFSAILDQKVGEATAQATAIMLTHVPMRELGEIRI